MSELQAKLVADNDLYVALILDEPIYSSIPLPSYILHLRPLKEPLDTQALMQPEVVLANGMHIAVTPIGSMQVIPDEDAIASGEWQTNDWYPIIKGSDLTAEQAGQARWYIRRRLGDMPRYDDPPL